jgi:hypothetical protein
MELKKYEKYTLNKIDEWEKKRPGKLIDTVSKPVDYILKKLGEKRLDKFETTVESILKKMLRTGTYKIDKKKLLKRAHESKIMINDLAELKTCDLWQLDKCNKKHINFHERVSMIQGTAAGIGGALIASADLTAIMFQVFHLIQDITFCYGFDPNDAGGKLILLRIIEAGIGGSENKFKALKEIDMLKKIQPEDNIDSASGKPVLAFSSKAMSE